MGEGDGRGCWGELGGRGGGEGDIGKFSFYKGRVKKDL